ncbi:hypothetical protein CAEBREN_12144 [Caenorhabditis brenneri]|uniref:BTB domain-containing protein n=1 Tax=Caenorhabditis brenneri TaxID=135651 RepID=G0NC85_CAEBE|nr:hypothetical protein CAEBREN_12144 [Caenorhabditis brenneri]
MHAEEEVELIKFKSQLRPVARGKKHYGEILSDHVECSHVISQERNCIIGYWWPVFDEILEARLKNWSGEVRVYKTDSIGKRKIAFARKVDSFMCYRVELSGNDTWRTIKLDYEFELRITKQLLKKIDYEGKFKKSEENNTAIEIENKIVFVNKQLLIDDSDYFRCLFSPEYCDSSKPIIHIGLSTFDEFCMLLSTFHPPHKEEIQDHQVEPLLDLADRYQMKAAMEIIRLHLIQDSTKIATNKKLWLAEKYRLPGVIDAVLDGPWHGDRENLKHRRYYNELSEETKRKI